jgi:peptidoglycan/xylan/chitin deacetylase (PgdA/CDA1 family)
MRKWIRTNALRTLHSTGMFARVRDSRWRQNRLLILCYHSFAIEEENRWRPALFLPVSRLQERLELLKAGSYNVIALGEGLERLRRGDLPPRSVALTFDDGSYDFYKLAYPLLKNYRFPATVYQTTFYSDRALPIFSLICSYMLWKKRDQVLPSNSRIGLSESITLQTPEARQAALNAIVHFAETQQLSTAQKNDVAGDLARILNIDYQSLLERRVLQLMNPAEIAELASAGIDFQLHTHRHRTPRDRKLFEREIDDNLAVLQDWTKSRPVHFCYPSGDYDMQFLPWLADKGVVSATTCDAGLASTRSNPLLLPRFIDTTIRTPLEFESWLTGVGALLSRQATTASLRAYAES